MKLNKRFKSLSNSSGFTLVEVVVVILILGILASIVSSVMLSKVRSARITALQSECMECVATAQTLLVEHQNYGTTFTARRIEKTAGVAGTIGLVRVCDGEVTHLYYTKGNETYIYSRYYDEVDPVTGKHNHQYNLYSYDENGDLVKAEKTSDDINKIDDDYGINSEYTYVDASLLGTFEDDASEEIYADEDIDNEGYKDDDPDQPTTRETVSTTETTTQTTTAAPTTTAASSSSGDGGSFYRRIMRAIFTGGQFNNTLAPGSSTNDMSPGNISDALPVYNECITFSDKSYVTYSDLYDNNYYYFVPYGTNLFSNITVSSAYIKEGTSIGFNTAAFTKAKELRDTYGADSDIAFEEFLAAWERAGYADYTKQYVSYLLRGTVVHSNGNGSLASEVKNNIVSALRDAGDSSKNDTNHYLIRFTCNKSTVQEANASTGYPASYVATDDSTHPKDSVSEGTVVKYNGEYYVALSYCGGPLKWYKFNENDGKAIQ